MNDIELRDYFAAKAMQSIMVNGDDFLPKISQISRETKLSFEFITAKLSYVYADAMLKAREKND